MQLQSPHFAHHQEIPARFTCQGEDISPDLQFSAVPPGTKSFVLIVEDPDAPSGTFVHWLAWDIPSQAVGLHEGEKAPKEGINGFGSVGYKGPCPPPGKPHRYFFRLFAVDTLLSLKQGASKEALLAAISGHILAQAELVGTYAR